MHKDLTLVANGSWKPTSFHNSVLDPVTPKKLIELLGEPDFRDEYKIQWEWDRILKTPEGKEILFTVYDYKEYRKIRPGTKYGEWHIGGENAQETEIVKDWINTQVRCL